jgi:two-component system sensor histidine kinase YesM
MLSGNEVIVNISDHLINMFRYSVKGEVIVPLKDELDICNAYIYIQKYRFEDRFDVIYDIQSHLLFHPIQKMLLHPLIENAINHGIEPLSKHSTLTVKCYEAEERVHLSVGDDGKGIESHDLQIITEMLNTDDTTYSKKHIGIYNLNARLINYYGKESRLNISSEFGKGTTISFSIPLNKGEQNG